MRDAPETSEKLPSKPAMAAIAVILAIIGVFMMSHGAGLVSAQWLNPNPETPQWVFAAIGCITLLAGYLTLARLVMLPKQISNLAGFVTFALAIVIMNWLVFFAEGASCTASGGGFVLETAGWLCTSVTRILTAVFDLLIAAVALPATWRRLAKRPAAP